MLQKQFYNLLKPVKCLAFDRLSIHYSSRHGNILQIQIQCVNVTVLLECIFSTFSMKRNNTSVALSCRRSTLIFDCALSMQVKSLGLKSEAFLPWDFFFPQRSCQNPQDLTASE